MYLSTWSIEAQLQDLAFIDSQEMQICHILSSFNQIFSSERLSFYRFSPIGYVAEGIVQLENDQFNSISYIRDDIRSLPVIRKVIEESKSIYYSGIDYVTNVSSRYLLKNPIQGILVVPILSNSLPIGYIVSEYFEKQNQFTSEDLHLFNYFGEMSGKYIVKQYNPYSTKLSPRENDIMEALINGLSTKEISYMLHLSEATVKQYIKKLLIKLNAKNRSHAVSIYLRSNVISNHS